MGRDRRAGFTRAVIAELNQPWGEADAARLAANACRRVPPARMAEKGRAVEEMVKRDRASIGRWRTRKRSAVA